jgi:thiamine kinase-like enzyme
LELLDGDALLHTDFNPLNILLGLERVWIIDWAWPTRGAAFIDAGCFLIRAMAAGHSPSEAEALAARCPVLQSRFVTWRPPFFRRWSGGAGLELAW